MSARSTTCPSARQTYCCLSRDLSVRCSMLKEIPELRAPEKRRTGMEMSPKVKWPDQVDDGIVSSRSVREASDGDGFGDRVAKHNSRESLAQNGYWMHHSSGVLGPGGTEIPSRRGWGSGCWDATAGS